ncbi:MAG TPA: hypothetical protein VGF97_01630 [Rhizomicrobium sp.]|jgi:hypothetical protein
MWAVLDLWHSINGIFTSADLITIAIMAVVAIGAGLAMQSMGSIITATVGALVIFSVAVFARAALSTKDAETLARTDWHNLLGLQFRVLIAYGIAFAVAITLTHTVRTLVRR